MGTSEISSKGGTGKFTLSDVAFFFLSDVYGILSIWYTDVDSIYGISYLIPGDKELRI